MRSFKKRLRIAFHFCNSSLAFLSFASAAYFSFCKSNSILLMWYYDENRIFPIYAILKQTSSLRDKKNAVYFFQISLFVPEIFEFLKYAN